MPYPLIEHHKISRKKRLFYVYVAAKVLISLSILFHGLSITDLYSTSTNSIMVQYLDIASLTIIRVISIITAVESFVNRRMQPEMFQKFHEVDQILIRIFGVDLRYDELRRSTHCNILRWAALFISVVTIIYTLASFMEEQEFRSLFLFYSFPLSVSVLNFVKYITFVKLVKYRYKLANRLLTQVSQFQLKKLNGKVLRCRDQDLNLLKKLKVLLDVYDRLWDVTQLINDQSQWSLLVNIVNFLLIVTANFYWSYLWTTMKSVNMTLNMGCCNFWTILMVAPITILARQCQNTVHEVIKSAKASKSVKKSS